MFLVWFVGVKIHSRLRSLDVIRDECLTQATDEEAEKYYKVLKISQGSGEFGGVYLVRMDMGYGYPGDVFWDFSFKDVNCRRGLKLRMLRIEVEDVEDSSFVENIEDNCKKTHCLPRI